MAINDIVQTIAEARVDARSLSEFVFKPAGFKVTRRLAPPVDTLQFYINRFNSLNGDFSSSVSVALSSLNSSVAEAEGKVAYIETTVQDAITDTIISSGFVTIDSFEIGATITQRNQALRHAADGRLYRWAGDLPKVVPVGSTPVNSGGIGENSWLEVSDVTFRQDLANPDKGASLVARSSVSVTSVGELAELSKDRKLTAVLSAGGRSGRFLWSGENLSSEVSSDPLQGLYVASVSDPSGASGAWVRQGISASSLFLPHFIDLSSPVTATELEAVGVLAKSLSRSIYSDRGFHLIGSVELSCGFECDGVITVDASETTSYPFMKFVQDETIQLGSSGLSGFHEGSRQITGLPDDYTGWTVYVSSQEKLLERLLDPGRGTSQPYRKVDVNRFVAGGYLEKPLEFTYTTISTLRLSYSKPSIVRVKIDVIGDGTPLEGVTSSSAVQIGRSNCDANVVILNKTSPYYPLATGCSISGVAGTIVDGYVDGTDYPELGYAFYVSPSYDLDIIGSTGRARKGVDGFAMHDVRIKGGTHSTVVGTHLAFGLDITDCVLSGLSISGGVNQQAISVCGRDINISGNTINMSVTPGTVNPRVVDMRWDSPYNRGYLNVTDNIIKVTDRSYTGVTATRLVSFEYDGIPESYDFEIPIYLFDSIKIRDNVYTDDFESTSVNALQIVVSNQVNGASYPEHIDIGGNSVNGLTRGVCSVTFLAQENTKDPDRFSGVMNLSGIQYLFLGVKQTADIGRYAINIENSAFGASLGEHYSKVSISNSEVRYISRRVSYLSLGIKRTYILYMNNCDIYGSSNYNAWGHWYIRDCHFIEEVPNLSLSDIIVSSGNWGVTQSFALDGLYNNPQP